MKITNKYNLPKAIENFADYQQNRKYSAGDADWSATTLIDSPRVVNLYKKHAHEIESDCSENIYAMLGSAMHHIFEKGAHFDHISEERLFMDVGDYRISGQIDNQEILPDGRIRITDYKVASTYTYGKKPAKAEWVTQQNIYATLVEHNKGVEVESINVCVVFRDWSKAKSKAATYPPAPVMLIKLPLWKESTRLAYIRKRVRLHAKARELFEERGEVERCTDAERWKKPQKHRVVAPMFHRSNPPIRNKTMRVFDTLKDAQDYVMYSGNVFDIESEPPIYERCNNWCKVAPWCSQLKAEVVERMMENMNAKE